MGQLLDRCDAKWLFDSLKNSSVKRDVKIARATHFMHLEAGRFDLYEETRAFLDGGRANRDGSRALRESSVSPLVAPS
jgi:hypothetical protein